MSMATVKLTEGKLLSRDESVIFAELPEELKREFIAEIAEYLRREERMKYRSPKTWYAARFRR